MEDWGRRFEELRDKYRRSDGSKWTAAALERATNGRASAHFIADLLRGRTKDPGIGKIRAISRAMGIPPEEWFKDFEDED